MEPKIETEQEQEQEQEKEKEKEQHHYSIKEVAQMFDLNQSTLRFWEKEFKKIKPWQNDRGTRFYSEENIENIRLVHHLVKERGMTLSGARQKLKDNPAATINQTEIYNRLIKIRDELNVLIEALDDYEPTPQK